MTKPDATDGETLVALTSEHWIRFVGPVLLAVVLTGTAVLLYLLAGVTAHHNDLLSDLALLGGTVLLLLAHHWVFMTLLGDSLDCIIVTDRRLLRIQYTPILHEDILEISFEKMKTVDARKQGLVQNVLNYGTLYFETKLATIPMVPHPNRLARVIQDAMQNS